MASLQRENLRALMTSDSLIYDVLRQPTPQEKLDLLDLLLCDIKSLYTHEDFLKHEPACKTDTIILTFLSIEDLFKKKNYEKIASMVDDPFIAYFFEKDTLHAPYIAKIARKYYLSCKNIPKIIYDSQMYFKALSSSSENNSKELVSVFTNICLDILVSNNQICLCEPYFQYEVLPADFAVNEFFKGFYWLVNGDFSKANDFLRSSEMMARNKVLRQKSSKLFVLSCLFLSKFDILESRKWKSSELAYYHLYLAITKGCERAFKKVLEKFKDVFVADQTYFIVRRLCGIVLMESVRKIGVVYSTISLSSVSEDLKIDIDALKLLMVKNLQSKVVCGDIQDDIFISKPKEKEPVDFESRIKLSFEFSEILNRMTNIQKPTPVRFENIDKTSLAYEFD